MEDSAYLKEDKKQTAKKERLKILVRRINKKESEGSDERMDPGSRVTKWLALQRKNICSFSLKK